MRGVLAGAANTMMRMKLSRSAVVALLWTVCAGALLGACGSSTKTASVAGAPAVSQRTSTATHTPSSTSTPTTPSGTNPSSSPGGTPGPTSTRTAPEPAFTERDAASEGLNGATAVLRAKGFRATSTSVYHPGQALRVLIGTRTGSSDGYGQQAFFFVNGRFIGTDSSQPSATVSVVSQGDTEVMLAYPLYRKGDPLSSPSGGQARVRFQLDNGKLAPLDPLPPASSSAGRLSRL